MTTHITTLIIGAGPAGSSLAHRLNQLGIPNIIIEKRQFPRPKLCGGALSARTLQLFGEDISGEFVTPVDTAILHFRDRQPITRKTKKPFVYIIDRYSFDNYLLDRAIGSGTQVIYADNWRVDGDKLIMGNYEVQFDYLAGCDGAYSRVRQHLEMKPSHGLGIEAYTDVTDDKGLHIYYDETHNGYGWVFPSKGNSNSIGIARLDNSKRKIKADFAAFQEKLKTNQPVDAHVIPVYTDENTYARGNIALAGDAGQLADHVLGEGIYYALSSGMILAESIEYAQKTGVTLETIYPKRLEPLLADLRNSSKIAKIIYTYPALCHRLASWFPAVIDIYLGLLSEKYAYTGMKTMLKKKFSFMKIFFPRVK